MRDDSDTTTKTAAILDTNPIIQAQAALRSLTRHPDLRARRDPSRLALAARSLDRWLQWQELAAQETGERIRNPLRATLRKAP